MKKGDVLGFANHEDTSVIGHQFETVSLLSTEEGLGAKLQDEITFDSLQFPFKFEIALTYEECK